MKLTKNKAGVIWNLY